MMRYLIKSLLVTWKSGTWRVTFLYWYDLGGNKTKLLNIKKRILNTYWRKKKFSLGYRVKIEIFLFSFQNQKLEKKSKKWRVTFIFGLKTAKSAAERPIWVDFVLVDRKLAKTGRRVKTRFL